MDMLICYVGVSSPQNPMREKSRHRRHGHWHFPHTTITLFEVAAKLTLTWGGRTAYPCNQLRCQPFPQGKKHKDDFEKYRKETIKQSCLSKQKSAIQLFCKKRQTAHSFRITDILWPFSLLSKIYQPSMTISISLNLQMKSPWLI